MRSGAHRTARAAKAPCRRQTDRGDPRQRRGLSGGDLHLVRGNQLSPCGRRGSGRGSKGGDHGHSRERLEKGPRRGDRRNGSSHEQDRQGRQIDRPAPPSETGFVRGQGPYRYHAIASNRADEDAVTTMERYCKRGDESRKPRSKDLKVGSSMEFVLRRTFQANAAFFAIGVTTHDLFGVSWCRAGQRVGACASADRAPAPVSDRGQDRPLWPANILEDQRPHAGWPCSLLSACDARMRKGRVVPETSSSRVPRFRTFGAKRRAADGRATPKILKTPQLSV